MQVLHISTVQWGWILGIFTLAYGYYLPVLLIGVIVLFGAFIWLKIDAEEVLA